jgi:hypothetical protein
MARASTKADHTTAIQRKRTDLIMSEARNAGLGRRTRSFEAGVDRFDKGSEEARRSQHRY